jgi:hypothetical protein
LSTVEAPRSVKDDATQRWRLRREVEQRFELQMMLAHAALVPAWISYRLLEKLTLSATQELQ